MLILTLCLNFLYLTSVTYIEACGNIANTTYGVLLGNHMVSRGERVFTAFLGVPYASPPTGSLRFMPPELPEKWEGVRNATREGKACIQREISGSEDCLVLNVFTHCPQATSLFPVMVYIHGGGFYGGSASLDMYGPGYLMDKNIVLVTIQYRLGVFGFLSTEDLVVPGNMGLKDQVRALQWVKDNIGEFGGDPSKVTIFGNSAGGASVHLHMQSPLSKGLFEKAISQSGTSFSGFSLIGKGSSRNITNLLAKNLHCPTTSSEEILDCLKGKDPQHIQHEYSKLQDANYPMRKVLFRPVVEEPHPQAFVTTSAYHTTTDKPWLVGVNKNEGLFKINMSIINDTIRALDNEYMQFLPPVLFFEDTCFKPEDVAETVYNFYFKNITRSEVISSLEHAVTDCYFFWPVVEAMTRHSGKFYSYLFEHEGENSFTQVLGGPVRKGVAHMDELHYLFTQKQFFPSVLNPEDTNISKLMVDLWTNFAHESNPTPKPISSNPQDPDDNKTTWNPSNKTDFDFFVINKNKLHQTQLFFQERINFWRSLPVRDKVLQSIKS